MIVGLRAQTQPAPDNYLLMSPSSDLNGRA